MTQQRLATIKACLEKRQTDLTVIMENVRKPHNLAAVARTLEAVGGLEIHAVSNKPSIRLTQMAAGGIKKWIEVINHDSIEQGIRSLKQRGHQIIATTLAPHAKDYREIDYTKPTAILVGEELEGISQQAVNMADTVITIPIIGMVQSLNVSVASALVLYEACHQRTQAGMYDSRSLDDKNYSRLLFKAYHPKIANYCDNKRLPYPAIDENAEILEPIAGNNTCSDDEFSMWVNKIV
ncbi:MAG: tRNA (guanosine(18)-2'-O)-methyltransferase TrmH [Gammaproteobacteria bacterium]|nr:tRNA (guanosine(18)-2'-O)-methyltransferase TrmH [Gammaproteobacteria bacterium]